MIKWCGLSLVLCVALYAYGFQDGFGETVPLHGLARMVGTGCLFTTILFALGHFDKNAEES